MENIEVQSQTPEENQRRKVNKKDEKKTYNQEKKKRLRIRLIPIWLRVIIVAVLIVFFFFIGAMIGYGVIGDGNPFDVFKKSTWTHIEQIVNEGTG